MIRLKLILFTVFICIIIPCGMSNERSMFIDTVEAFDFLSKHHHELHIMIGEDEGDFKKAYNSFYKYISGTSNDRLLPVKNGFFRIKDLQTGSKDVKDFDALVDYYQSGLSLEIEGILKGYGYYNTIEIEKAVDIYDKIKK